MSKIFLEQSFMNKNIKSLIDHTEAAIIDLEYNLPDSNSIV